MFTSSNPKRTGQGFALAVLLLASTWIAATSAEPKSAEQRGTLVIVGGGLKPDNAAVYSAFIDALPNRETDRVAILPAASGEPASSAERLKETLGRYGVGPDRIDIVELAVRDDPNTADIDESSWRENAESPEQIAKIRAAGGIFISGGDQRRLTELLAEDGPMLAVIRERLISDAVVGGTSAGAAVMSHPMITGGDPLAALTRRPRESLENNLTLDRGFGFFGFGLVDQHFGERARLGRLAMAIAAQPEGSRIGFGVDEDTAIVVSLADQELVIKGSANVTMIDGRKASFTTRGDQFAASGLRVSVLSPGDRVALSDLAVTIAESRKATVGSEYYDEPPADGSGMAVAQPRLSRLLGASLLDNESTRQLERVSFSAAGRGVLYRFKQDRESGGYWGYDAAGTSRYSIVNVRFDIVPVAVSVEPL